MFNLVNFKGISKSVTLRQRDTLDDGEKFHQFSDFKALVDYFVKNAKSEVVSEITKNYSHILRNKDFSMVEKIINSNYSKEFVSVDIFED